MTKLNLSVNCSVALVHTDDTKLSYETNREDCFTVNKEPNGLSISQTGQSSSGTTIISSNGRTIMTGTGNVVQTVVSGGSVVIGDGNGDVWVNGKRINLDEINDEPQKESPRLRILVPEGTDLRLTTRGNATIAGNAKLGDVSISTSGSSDIILNARDTTISSSGSSDITINNLGGKVKANCSGSTQLEIR